MLEKAVVIGIDSLPDTKEKQNRNIGDKFLKYFSDENRSLILEILEAGKYIPGTIRISFKDNRIEEALIELIETKEKQ